MIPASEGEQYLLRLKAALFNSKRISLREHESFSALENISSTLSSAWRVISDALGSECTSSACLNFLSESKLPFFVISKRQN